MTRKLIRAATLLLIGASLSACFGGGGGGGGTTVVAPPPAARFEDQFGTNFGAGFRGAANTEPRDVAPGDVGAPSLTTEPAALPGT